MNKHRMKVFLATLSLCITVSLLKAQTTGAQVSSIPPADLSGFANPPKNWQLASRVHADLDKTNTFELTKGYGLLVNMVDDKNPGHDLYTTMQHGDIDIELDYMMAKGANSGIY